MQRSGLTSKIGLLETADEEGEAEGRPDGAFIVLEVGGGGFLDSTPKIKSSASSYGPPLHVLRRPLYLHR